MSKQLDLNVQKRTVFGRKIKKLRQEGILPANIYGKDVKSIGVQIDLKTFSDVYKQTGETGLVNLTVGKETKARPVLIHNLQKDPVTDEPLHVDFRQVDLTKKVTADIPLEFISEAPAVEKGGVVVQLMDEVEVEALPTDFPDKIEVDVSRLAKIGDSIALKDLKIDTKKVKLTEENLKTLVVQIEEPTKEEEKPAEETAPTEGEEAEVKEGEEEKPAEGEEKKEGGEEKKPEEGQKQSVEKPAEGQPQEKKEEKK